MRGTQPVTFASPEYGTVPTEAPMHFSIGAAHIQEGVHGAATAAAPMAKAGPGMAPASMTKGRM